MPDAVASLQTRRSAPPPPDPRLIPQFCRVCGAKLEQYEERGCFDEYTGQPRMLKLRRCPNRRKLSHWFGL